MIILPSRVKNEDEKKKTGLILPSRVKDAKTVEQTESVLPKKTVVLPPKKQVSEVEAYNKEQSGFWKTIARVLLPKKLESKYGVEKIEPVKTTLSGGWENLTPEQQDTAKEIFKKETPTALKAKVPMFFQSLKETSTKDIPYYGSGKEAVELVGIARAYNRVKDGKGTEQDKILLNDYYEEQERQTELQKNVGYRAGETIKGSVRFMGELLPVAIVEALTGTLAPAGEVYAASKLAQKGTKQVIEGMIKDKVTRDLVKDVAKKKLATLTKQFIITAPTNITAGTAERMIGVVDTETGEIYQEGQPISDAIVNATTGHAVELITELGGGVSGKVLGGLTAPVKKIATKTAIFNALRKKLIGASDAKIEALLRKTGWNGVIGEFFEERDADILNQALYSLGLGDQKFEGLTKDDIATELIAFSVMGGGVAGIKSVKRLKEGLQKRQDIKKMQETKVKMPPKKAPVIQEAEILRGTKGMTADDIMATYPNIKLKRDIPATTIGGVKTTIKEGEKLTPYELKGNKILLQDGKTYIVSKNQFQNIKGQSVVAEGKPFAPELEGLEETVKGVSYDPEVYNKYVRELKEKYDPSGRLNMSMLYDELPKTEQVKFNQMKKEQDTVRDTSTKYSSYTLPGGENYREILIKAPDTRKTVGVEKIESIYDLQDYFGKKMFNEDKFYKLSSYQKQQVFDNPEYSKLRDKLKENKVVNTRVDITDEGIKSQEGAFKSSHWGEPNVISHIRLNDRTYKGKKVTFMEELQSDWAREGRDKGFSKNLPKGTENDIEIKFVKSNVPEGHDPKNYPGYYEAFDKRTGDFLGRGGTKPDLMERALEEINLTKGVPYNPLLKNWQVTSIKRALIEAVNTNADYFAWTNGEQQKARYDLATYVQDIKWKKRPNDRGKHIDITPKSGNDIKISIAEDGKIQSAYGKSDWEGKKLDEVLGKGLADKIMAKERGTLSGEGLKFGGEWASNLYDKQVKNIVEDLTGQKVEMLDMGLPIEKAQADDISQKTTQQQAIKLTPEVKNKIKGIAPKIKTSGKMFEEKPQTKTVKMPPEKVEDPLIQKAKKYESAEEFVNDNLEVDTLLPSDRPMGEKTLADFKYTGSKVNKQKVKVSPIEDVINKAKTLADSGGDGSVGNYEVYDVLKKVNNGRIKVYHGTSETGANAIGGGWAGLKDGSYLSLTKGADKEALGVYGAKYYADIAERYGKNGQVLEFDIPLKNIAIDNTTGELRYVSDKTKSQLEEIWNRAQEVSPVEQKVVEKVEPIKYKSTIGKSGLAQSVRRKAIREKLIYGFDKRFRDLPEYDKRVKTEDRDKAIDFVLNDTDNAYEVAMGRQKPKGDMLPEDVYVVMVDYLTEIEDVEKVLDLTMNSELVGEATLMGQRIQALSQLDPLNPAKVLNDIKKEKEKALAQDKKKRGKKSKAEETRDMKDKIDKDTQKGVNQSRKKVKTWVELVESLKC